MRATLRQLYLLPACFLLGCTGASDSSVVPPHGGNMVALPGGRGFVELMIDQAAGPTSDKRDQGKSRIAAYFYQSDGTTEMSPAPTDVKVRVGTSDKSPTLSLTQEAKEAGKYVSEASLLPDGFHGQVEANVSGQHVEAPFNFR